MNIYWFYRPPQSSEIGAQSEVVLAETLNTKQYAEQRNWRYIGEISLTCEYWRTLYSETQQHIACAIRLNIQYTVGSYFWTIADYAIAQEWQSANQC
jgi:hypothetical protein